MLLSMNDPHHPVESGTRGTVEHVDDTMLGEVKKEYWMMVCLVIGNIPLLYMLNTSWFEALMFSIPGKIVLAICGVVIFITAMFMMKYTKPIEYKK